jgi:hypothetical protein
MSLDVNLMVIMPVPIHSQNITHNLANMAGNVYITSEMTLYDVLWRPEEYNLVYAKDIADHLHVAWNILLSEPEFFKQFNPENGWGNYDTLLGFVYNYRNKCYDNPEALVEVSR